MLPKDTADIASAQSFSELATVALGIVNRMDEPIGMVCGPISTGGAGSISVNLLMFNAAIQRLKNSGLQIFDQMPFEDAVQRLKDKRVDYDQRILVEFYATIFNSGRITTQYFMFNWMTSRGARWEHDQAKERGACIVYLDEEHVPIAA